ncbi:MAG: transferase [Dictyoglomus sp. NZ13-RE01]|nr:MAG: transferase [Dictyoglomus sp. NZ13-RE01]
MSKKVVIIGAGGHAKVVASTLLICGYNVIGFLDDDEKKIGTKLLDIPVIGNIELLKEGNFDFSIIAIGDNSIRRKIYYLYKEYTNFVSIIHPFSYVHSSVEIGEGSVIFAGVVIQPDVRIGNNVIVNTSVSIDHDCVIGDFVHLAPGVHLAGGVIVEEGAFLGIGSSVIQYRKVGKWSILGAGGCVIKDIPEFTIAVGVPAIPVKENKISI